MYTKEHRQQRLAAALRVIDAMVKRGFTFFSSVAIDSVEHPYHVELEPGGYAVDDRMFFHIVGKKAMVSISLHTRTPLSYDVPGEMVQYLDARVWLERDGESGISMNNWKEYQARIDAARVIGHTTMRWNDSYGWSESEVLQYPWFHKDPELKLWTYHGGMRKGGDYCALHVESTKRLGGSLEEKVNDLADSILSVETYLAAGQLSEVIDISLLPHYSFRDCEQDFWSRFNTRYFRQLVKRVIG